MKSSKFKVQSSKLQNGFTLIELLVAIVITVSTLTITVGIVTSTLRGTNKTNTINKVRENGSYTISQISRMIAYPKSFDGASVDGNPPWSCQVMPPLPTPTPTIAHYKSVRITSFDKGVSTFSCNGSADTPPNTIASSSAESNSLIDTTSLSLRTPISDFCFFTCRQANIADSPTIGINFTLTSKSTSGVVETIFSIPFEASIKIRN